MTPINSRAKGANNERTAARILSEWTGSEFTRIPASGGLRWDNRVDVCGDLISTDPAFDFPFSIETKFYKKLGLKGPLLRANSIIFKFMAQCKRDAIKAGKFPFLMVRENNMPKDSYYIFLHIDTSKRHDLLGMCIAQFMDKDQTIMGFRSELFFKNISFENIKELYNGKFQN